MKCSSTFFGSVTPGTTAGFFQALGDTVTLPQGPTSSDLCALKPPDVPVAVEVWVMLPSQQVTPDVSCPVDSALLQTKRSISWPLCRGRMSLKSGLPPKLPFYASVTFLSHSLEVCCLQPQCAAASV